jgi:hypothetical protein
MMTMNIIDSRLQTQLKRIMLLNCLLLSALLPAALSFQSSNMNSLRSLAGVRLFAGKGIAVDDILKNPQWPDKWPFKPQDFSRQVRNIHSLEGNYTDSKEQNFLHIVRMKYTVVYDANIMQAIIEFIPETNNTLFLSG